MTALRPAYVDGVWQFAPDVSATARTDASGDYRITGLAPGTYAENPTLSKAMTLAIGHMNWMS